MWHEGIAKLALAAVPEPSTLALFGLGFGVLGFSLRRNTAQLV
jgi:PEP-CTERM motif